ncbi:MAG: LptF/LptG family permease [Alphaproteobacteria bacterium]|nr:LptF/LptG family permease [Alphaproteobacteria bacterium]
MKRINKVIFFKILRTTMYSTIALTLCAWIVQSSRYLDMLNQYNISLARFFKFSSYLCVDIIAVILPISFAISAAFVFFRFVQSNQLIAMQASGIPAVRLLNPLIALASIITTYLYISNVYISPNAWSSFRRIEFEIKNNIEPPESAGSIFSINGFSVYAQEYVGNFSFRNLFILDLRNLSKSYSYYARSGSIRNNTLFLENGERIEIDNVSKKNSIIKFEAYQYDLKELLNVERTAIQPNEKYMRDLLANNTGNDLLNKTQVALFHQKITSPLLTFIFSLLSFFMILMSPYKRDRGHFITFLLILFIVIFQGTYFWVTNAAARDFMFIKINYLMVMIPIIIFPLMIFWRSR